MPRKSQWPPRVLPHRPSGQDRVRIDGQDIYLGPIGSPESRAEYARLVSELAAGRKATRTLPPEEAPPLTVGDILAQWLLKAAPLLTRRGHEERQYKATFVPLERLFGRLPAASFGAGQLEDLQTAMATGSWMDDADRANPSRRGRTRWCRRVVNARIGRVRSVWRWAERRGLVPPGSWAALGVVAPLQPGAGITVEAVQRRPASLDEVKAVCRCFPRSRPVLRALLLVQWWSGCRPGEVRTMRAGDVDTADPRCWVYRPRQHKTDRLGHQRVIPLGPRGIAVLRPWLLRALAVGPDAPVFPVGRKGRPYTWQGYSAAVTTAAERAGMPEGWCAYSTRHGARDRIGRAEGDEAARAILGHATLSTTARYGQKIDHAFAAEVARRRG